MLSSYNYQQISILRVNDYLTYIFQTNNFIPQHQHIPKSSTFSQPDKITRKTKIKQKICSKLQKEGYNIQQKGCNIQTYQPIHHLNSPPQQVLIYQQNKKLKINQHNIKQHSKSTHNLKNYDHPNQQQLTTDSQQPSTIHHINKITPINNKQKKNNQNNITSNEDIKYDVYRYPSKKFKNNLQYQHHQSNTHKLSNNSQEIINKKQSIINVLKSSNHKTDKNRQKQEQQNQQKIQKHIPMIQNAISEKDQQISEEQLTPNNVTKISKSILQSQNSQSVKSIMSILQVKETSVRQYLVQYQDNSLKLFTSQQILHKHYNEFISYLENQLNNENSF